MARMDMQELVRQLALLYGDELAAVVLYGSAATGEQIPGRSDTNVLVLVERLDLDRLTRESAVARAWSAAGNPPPLTLTLAEWHGSADVFPMEYADILERNRVLHGALPLEGIRVDREHLRLQAEQQALGKLLQLRQGVLAAGPGARERSELLAASLSTFLTIFRAVLRLAGERPPPDAVAVTERTAALAGFDPEPFVRVLRHARGERKLSPAEATPVLEAYLSGAQELVAHVDRSGGPPPSKQEVP